MKAAVRLALEAAEAILKAILAIIAAFCRLLGVASPSMPQPPRPTTTPEDVAAAYRDEYTREIANDHAHASDVGMAVHQYAAAIDPAIRGAVDISGLSAEQTDWLLGLREEDLQRLVAAGPKACELAVSGKKCGVVGLPIPTTPQIEGPRTVRHPARDLLVDRIRDHAARVKLVT
ncbi:hypothetical protein BPNPMPFG_006310 [Mesorhizobium sp. AR07]|uniref:hypothetical protein n=1 Tax=Mesorhizobium sp. AR07 TaxID=2865838 RepID=UPI00215E0B2E|nr:hypothetical protein [Mesorhizobium sp. AR07]UVK44395.1 hypothetical protein BPNPMPFG_006310 [Mesorhizobium sp. AR07]